MIFKCNSFLVLFFLLSSLYGYSQVEKADSLKGKFVYTFTYKPSKTNKDLQSQEFFSLQISDEKAFFISENSLKFDSIFKAKFTLGQGSIDMSNFPNNKPMSRFLIIQTHDESRYYESIGRARLYYTTPVIKNWKLIDEIKMIGSLKCKKAEIHFKGRDWVAWYSTEIPFPYGPYKFSGLPGLIIKITDTTGDFDFELAKAEASSKLKGKLVAIRKRQYTNAKLVTKKDLSEANNNLRQNAKLQLEAMGTVFPNDQKENAHDRQLRIENERKDNNLIELED